MCGIAGFATVQVQAPGGEETVRRMAAAIRHRGPDDFGCFVDDHAALGHRRLSIIDVTGGHQPMRNETGSQVIIYNGEIFNHAEIRPALEQQGHRYETRCDTETIVHAYEQHGPDCVRLFRGMFAFAIWDQEKRTLFCARDRLGIKPLYYFWDGQLFAFASEIKALLEHPGISAALNEGALPEYLAFGFLSGEETLFRGIRKLMPGHHLTLDLKAPRPELRIERYWDSLDRQFAAEESGWREQDWIRELRRRLEETVRMRLMSDVPLGMFLSGGVDSSAIAALIRRMADGPVKTFAVGYREAQFSELSYAAQVAQSIGTEHREVVIGRDDFFGALPNLIWHEDEPISWPSSVSLYFVSKLAASEVKVVLTGEGSDELFGGYERYRWNLINSRAARAWNAVPGSGMLRRWTLETPLLSASTRRRVRHTFVGREPTVESLFLDNFYCAFSREEQNGLLSSRADSVYGGYLRYWQAAGELPPLARMLYADQKTYLVELLMKQDQMSMAASIESRVPFLDHTFVEFAARIPDGLKIRNGEQKYVLKRAVEDLLPKDIIYRKKMGFPTPLRQWLLETETQPLIDALSAPDGLLAAHLNLDRMKDLIDRHRAGSEDATDRLWRLINLQIWGDVFLTGRRERWMAPRGERDAALQPAL